MLLTQTNFTFMDSFDFGTKMVWCFSYCMHCIHTLNDLELFIDYTHNNITCKSMQMRNMALFRFSCNKLDTIIKIYIEIFPRILNTCYY